VPNLANPQEWNRYGYCVNNPTRYIDPRGHQIEPPEYQPFGIAHTGTTGPYVSSADATVQYEPAKLYWTASPPRRVRTTAALIQRQEDALVGSSIAYAYELIAAVGGAAAAAQAAKGGATPSRSSRGDPRNWMPPGQAAMGARTSGTGSPVVPLNTAMFSLSREGEFTAGNFRHNLAQIRPLPEGGNYDAHHMLAKTFETHPGVASVLEKTGVSVHDPRWGTWWERGPEGTHQQKWYQYNQEWSLWLKDNPTPAFDQLVTQAEALGKEYKLDWSGDLFYYNNPYTIP
jgi:hypothetical protein